MAIADLTRVIAPLKAARAADVARRRWRGSAVLPCLVALDEIEEGLKPYLEEVLEAFPLLFRQRRLYDGAYVLSLHGALPRPGQRRPTPSCTTLEFAITILDGGDRATLEARIIVADRELPGDRLELDRTATGRWELDAFVEQACLDFAKAYAEAAGPRG
jgi:hypothetical protein